MNKTTQSTKDLSAVASTQSQEPSVEAVRDYAYHLYEQGSHRDGHDLDDWLEATACLKAHIPPTSTHSRLHLHVTGSAQTRSGMGNARDVAHCLGTNN